MKCIIFSCLLVLTIPSVCIAADPSRSDSRKEESDKLPAKGRIAGATNSGNGALAFEGVWGGENISGKDAPPISGSVNRLGDEWEVNVMNNTEDKYRASLKLQQYDANKKRLKAESFSVSLKAGESYSRRYPAHGMAANADLDLSSWKKVEKAQSNEEILAEIELKKKELAELEAKVAPVKPAAEQEKPIE